MAHYGVLSDSTRPFELDLQPDARRFGIGFPAPNQVEWALVALDVLEQSGIDAIHARATELADRLAQALDARVAPRGRSTLVSWEDADPEATVARLQSEGLIVRNLPSSSYVRASVGAWSSEEELDRLVELA